MEGLRFERGADVGLERAAGLLGMDEAEVEALGTQGRLEDRGEPGEPRYKAADVLRMRAENLIRELEEETKRDPDLSARIGMLAALQYHRGRIRGAADVFDREFEGIAERLDKKPDTEDGDPKTGA